MMAEQRSQLILKLTLIATVFSLMVIALGAYTRLVHAGLGCPDWPTCYGHLWAPLSTTEIANANNAYPDSPVNLAKTWPEMIHRYLASALGLMCIVIAVTSFKLKNKQALSLEKSTLKTIIKPFPYFHSPYLHSLGILALVILQGMFGMWTVTLKLWPQVVTLHLLGGFSTFSLLLLLYLRLAAVIPNPDNKADRDTSAKPMLRILAVVVLVVVFIQVMLGGWTSANYAAMACPQLPWCSIGSLTLDDLGQGFNWWQKIGPNYLGGQLDGGARVAIHAVHRVGALLVICLSAGLIISLYRQQQGKLALMLAVMVSLQVGLGVSNVYFQLPLFNAVAHNIGGALLVGVLIVINYRLSQTQRQLIS